jgi:hypothetical protein
MAEAKRYFEPGMWGRSGRAIPDAQACEYEADVRYPLPDYRQGRDATNRVPPFSMLAGKPDEFSEADGALRAMVWKVLAVALIVGWSVFAAALIAGVQP